MDSFQTRLKVKTIRADLLALPKGLDAYDTAYDDAMTRIFGQERDYQESAEKILSLILCAQRPLTSRELQHALMIETGDTELDLDNSLDSETMLSVCAGLITIDESSDTIRFDSGVASFTRMCLLPFTFPAAPPTVKIGRFV